MTALNDLDLENLQKELQTQFLCSQFTIDKHFKSFNLLSKI